jgi:hypothetical protein
MASERSSEDIVAADKFRCSLLPRADAGGQGFPLWHGWALMDAFLAGVDHARPGWQPIETAPHDPKTSIEMGFWNDEADRWEWLTHGTWDERRKEWRDDERCCPTHWRSTGRPVKSAQESNHNTIEESNRGPA